MRPVNNSNPHAFLKDEAEYGMSWCITLIEEMVGAERAYLSNLDFDTTILNHTKDWVFERFNNLESGLMSNGLSRDPYQ